MLENHFNNSNSIRPIPVSAISSESESSWESIWWVLVWWEAILLVWLKVDWPARLLSGLLATFLGTIPTYTEPLISDGYILVSVHPATTSCYLLFHQWLLQKYSPKLANKTWVFVIQPTHCRVALNVFKSPLSTMRMESGHCEKLKSCTLDLVIRSGYAKKDHFSILPVIQNIWDLHKFGLQIWIQNAKITLWKNFGQYFWFHRFCSSCPGMRKKASFQY